MSPTMFICGYIPKMSIVNSIVNRRELNSNKTVRYVLNSIIKSTENPRIT